MDTIDVFRTANFESEDAFEVLGCSAPADEVTLTKAYRDLARKYHPDGNHGDYEDEALFRFYKVSAAYASLVDQEIPSSEEEAREEYENRFGVYRGAYYGAWAIIGLPFAFELKERLDPLKLKRLSASILGFRVHLFRSWTIKWKLNPLLLVFETLLSWGVSSICVLSWILGEEKMGWVLLHVVGPILLASSLITLHFWYGFTRYPSIGERGVVSWLHGGASDSDMEEIRDVCSYFFHYDHYKRSQMIAKFISIPFALIDHAWALFLSAMHSLGAVNATASPVELQIMRAACVFLSIASYCLVWVFGGNYGKLAVSASLVVNRNLYNAILLRKGLGEFLLGLILGENFAVTLEKAAEGNANKRKTEEIAESVISTSSNHEITDESDVSIDLETTASIWRRIDESSTKTGMSNRTSATKKTQNCAKTKKTNDDIGKTKTNDDAQKAATSEDIQNTSSLGSFSLFDTMIKSLATEDSRKQSKDESHRRGLTIDSGDENNKSVKSSPSSIGTNNQKSTSRIPENSPTGGNFSTRSQDEMDFSMETSTAAREKKKKVVRFYKAIKRRIEGDFYGGLWRKRYREEEEEDYDDYDSEDDDEDDESYDLDVVSSLGDDSSLGGGGRAGVRMTNNAKGSNARGANGTSGLQSALSMTTKESTLTSMGREYEELVMNNSYIVSANPTFDNTITVAGETTIYTDNFTELGTEIGTEAGTEPRDVGTSRTSSAGGTKNTKRFTEPRAYAEEHTEARTLTSIDDDTNTERFTEVGTEVETDEGDYTEGGISTYVGDDDSNTARYTEAGTEIETYAGDYTEANTLAYTTDGETTYHSRGTLTMLFGAFW